MVSRQAEYARFYPERLRARVAVHHAIQTGTLPHPAAMPCADCGGTAQEYHHWRGYGPEQRLDVRALCTRCHGRAHRTGRAPRPLILDWADVPDAQRATAAMYADARYDYMGWGWCTKRQERLSSAAGWCAAAYISTLPGQLRGKYEPCDNRARPDSRYCGIHEAQRGKREQHQGARNDG